MFWQYGIVLATAAHYFVAGKYGENLVDGILSYSNELNFGYNVGGLPADQQRRSIKL